MSPTSKDSCQSTINQKASWTPPTALEEGVTSLDKASILREGHEVTGNLRGDHSNCYKPTFFVTKEACDKSGSPRVRRQTWNGIPLPMMQQPVSFRKRSYSDKDQPSACDSTETPMMHTDYQKAENIPVQDLKTAWHKPSGFTKVAFPTAEDAVLRRDLLTLPEYPIRKASSLVSLRSWQSLPPVLENKNYASEGMNNEADEARTEGVASDAYTLEVNDKETYASQPYRSASPFLLLQRRHEPLRRQGNVTEVPLSLNAPKETSKEFERAGESRAGAVRKVPVRYKTIQTGDDQVQLVSQETTVSKNASTKREKLALKQTHSLPTLLGQSSREEIRKPDIRKKKESVKSKQKPGLDKDPETKEKEATVPIDKSKWMKALKKVFNVNLFLGGMAALHKQRELDRLALEQKEAELEQLYRELQHCRYLRMPSKEDSEQTDSVSWVFEKD